MAPVRTVHAYPPAALSGGGTADDETVVNGGEDRVKKQEERKDHRQLGAMMDMFCFPKPKIGAMGGLGPALLPRGLTCMLQLQKVLRKLQEKQGFEEVRTGSLAQAHLWHRSGHMQHFADNMFAIADPRERGSDTLPGDMQNVEMPQQEGSTAPPVYDAGTSYLLKPMSCPLHLSYFFDRSVRLGSALPLRICEFGHVYRREVPSALCGLMRMREFTQDDGHILCRMSQALEEVTAFLSACQKLYKAAGFCKGEIIYHISTRPESSQGSEQEWADAEGLLRSALEQLEIPFTVARGEGAFYGPKIDIHLPGVDGRLWQTGTLQVDMFSPKNFGLEPTPENNDRLCLLHRAMCGSLERFLGLVLEHLDGHLPSWLAPTQVKGIFNY
ncbi:threonyl-tRNA synthetase, putative [Eimeria mitis]|uniref:threonine--tRNA ligase n=1 Tax=Eimeria mitis TaxID=44415 RepID=U6JTT9_9EIME|nr:threonyl-tRNA synthetase, putative [Eimeria mitis]CDJ27482.1 threonyl-tRNA synthetase, putative [Eimeria mitis]